MKMPGKGWLQFEIIPVSSSKSILDQTAFFEPKGFFGHLYWYMLYPFHKIIFRGMIRELAHRAEALDRQIG